MTIKTIAFLPRLSSVSRAQFREHYEQRHAPLAAGLFAFTRYRRNHLTDPDVEPGFDCISEFWVSALDDIVTAMAGEPGAIMRKDELNFLDQSRASAAFVDSIAQGDDTASRLLLVRNAGGNVDDLARVVEAAGAGLDLLKAMDRRALPCDALIRARTVPSLPTGWSTCLLLDVALCESPPSPT